MVASRDGKKLIVPRGAALPASCVKCGQPAHVPWVKKFAWHHPAILLVVLINILIYAIVALIVQKKMELKVPLCDFHHMERKRWIIIGWLCVIGCIPAGMITSMVLNFEDWIGFLVGLVTFFACVVFFNMANLIRPTKIDEHGAEFKGAGEAFLSQLPAKSL